MNSEVGTPHWMALEVFRGHYTEKADVFSLGAIFFAILQRDCVDLVRFIESPRSVSKRWALVVQWRKMVGKILFKLRFQTEHKAPTQ